MQKHEVCISARLRAIFQAAQDQMQKDDVCVCRKNVVSVDLKQLLGACVVFLLKLAISCVNSLWTTSCFACLQRYFANAW